MKEKLAHVFISLARYRNSTPRGNSHLSTSERCEICSFSYDSTWLSSYYIKYTLDPELQLFEGREYHYVSLKVILDYF